MRQSKILTRILLLVIFSLTVTGCGLQEFLDRKNKNATTSGEDEQTVVGVVLNEKDPNQALIRQGIEDMAQKEGVKIVMLSEKAGSQSAGSQTSSQGKSEAETEKAKTGKDTSGKGKQDKQNSTNDILQGAKVILFQGGSGSEILSQAEEKNIPVVALTQVPTVGNVQAIIYPDQEEAGQIMANMLVSRVTEGDVVILQENPNDVISQELLTANQAVLKKYGKIVSHVITNPSDSQSVALQNFSSLVQKEGAKLKGVIAHSETLAAQAYQILKQAKLESQVVLVGGQANLQSLERINEGVQIGDIDTAPYLQGVNAYQMASRILKQSSLDLNDSVATEQGMVPGKKIAVKQVTKDNLDLVKNSYSKAVAQAEQAQKQAAEKNQAAEGGGEQAKSEAGGENKEKNQESDKGQAGKSSPPAGTAKVREKVKTETVREYLDEKGQVISTEESVLEENRVVPPDALEKSNQPQNGSSQAGQSSVDKKADSDKSK